MCPDSPSRAVSGGREEEAERCGQPTRVPLPAVAAVLGASRVAALTACLALKRGGTPRKPVAGLGELSCPRLQAGELG